MNIKPKITVQEMPESIDPRQLVPGDMFLTEAHFQNFDDPTNRTRKKHIHPYIVLPEGYYWDSGYGQCFELPDSGFSVGYFNRFVSIGLTMDDALTLLTALNGAQLAHPDLVDFKNALDSELYGYYPF